MATASSAPAINKSVSVMGFREGEGLKKVREVKEGRRESQASICRPLSSITYLTLAPFFKNVLTGLPKVLDDFEHTNL